MAAINTQWISHFDYKLLQFLLFVHTRNICQQSHYLFSGSCKKFIFQYRNRFSYVWLFGWHLLSLYICYITHTHSLTWAALMSIACVFSTRHETFHDSHTRMYKIQNTNSISVGFSCWCLQVKPHRFGLRANHNGATHSVEQHHQQQHRIILFLCTALACVLFTKKKCFLLFVGIIMHAQYISISCDEWFCYHPSRELI